MDRKLDGKKDKGTKDRKKKEMVKVSQDETEEGTENNRTRKEYIKPDIPRLLAMQKKHPDLTHQELADTQGLARSTVTKVLLRYGIEKEKLDEFKTNRADIMAGLQEKILQSITTGDLEKASLQQRMMAFGILYDKERLETGKSTTNVNSLTVVVDAAKARREAMLKGQDKARTGQDKDRTEEDHTLECEIVEPSLPVSQD